LHRFGATPRAGPGNSGNGDQNGQNNTGGGGQP